MLFTIEMLDNNIRFLMFVFNFSLIIILTMFLLIYGYKTNAAYVPIYSISLTLILYHSAVTNYIHGWDLHKTLYFTRKILNTGVWDPTLVNERNSIIFITLYPAQLSTILNLEIVMVYKYIFPIILATLPLLLFRITNLTFSRQAAMGASLLYIFNIMFFSLIPGKQRMVLLFVAVLYLLLLRSAQTNGHFHNRILLVIVPIFISFSHYATSAILIVALYSTYLADSIIRRLVSSDRQRVLSFRHLIIITVPIIVWMSYSAQGYSSVVVVRALDGALKDLGSIFTFGERTGASIAASSLTKPLLDRLRIYLYILVVLSFSIGYGIETLYQLKTRFQNPRYPHYLMAAPWFGLLGLAFFVRAQFGAPRALLIASLLLTPYAFTKWGELIDRNFGISLPSVINNQPKALTILLILFLVLNSGLGQVAFYQDPTDKSAVPAVPEEVNYPIYSPSEVSSGNWINSYGIQASYCGADRFGSLLLQGYVGYRCTIIDPPRYDSGPIPNADSMYVLLRTSNIKGEFYTTEAGSNSNMNYKNDSIHRNSIYTSGGARIEYIRESSADVSDWYISDE